MTDPATGAVDVLGRVNAARQDTAGVSDRARERAEVQRLAEEFEGMLMTQMIRDMRRAMLTEEDGATDWSALSDTVDVEFGRALSAAGGMGLAKSLITAFERLLEPAPGADQGVPISEAAIPEGGAHKAAPGAAATDQPEPAADRAPMRLELPGDVTSGFGWRRDPFSGTTRFHAGVDIAMAYGQEVAAAADGRVVFSGERGGYGNLVVIQHPDGRETRYAHLAEPLVREGEEVQPGQVIGRSGRSGRATGPHLHFEVLDRGRPTDPAAVTGAPHGPGTKGAAGSAD